MANQETAKALPPAGDSHPTVYQDLLAQAREAEARYDHETAVALYTAALDLPDLTAEERYEVLAGRVKAYWHWGYGAQAEDDWLALIEIAREAGDPAFLAETIVANSGESQVLEPAAVLGREALSIARDLGDRRLLAQAKMLVARGDRFQDWGMAHEALKLARELGDRELIFQFSKLMLTWVRFGAESGRPDSEKLLGEIARMAHESGSLVEQTDSLKLRGSLEVDLARALAYSRQAFAGYQTINNQFDIDRMANSIALRLLKLGLFRRALDYAQLAVEGSRRRDHITWVANCLSSVGRAYLALGLLDEAQKAFEEGENLPHVTESWRLEHVYGLGLIALERGQMNEAIGHLEEVASTADSDFKPHARADLALAYLSKGDLASARRHSHEAVSIIDPDTDDIEYPIQNVWWRRYQVLQAAGAQGAFEALDRAQKAMFKAIESLSDEGMRRNYLNKVAINRKISLAWTVEAARRGLSLAPFTDHKPKPGNLREQFQRVVEIGGRLSAQHDPDTLAEFIVDEFVELSGAERVLLRVLDAEGNDFSAASFNPGTAQNLAGPLLEKIRHDHGALLRTDIGEVPQGEVPALHRRSLIALPLITQGRLLGVLYGDMRQVFGRFDEADLNLLSMLANQAAAALENADLVSTLEERVEQRTAELNARVSELAIINSVQEGLVAELDLQAIFDIVGDKLTEIFAQGDVSLFTYDAVNDKALSRYFIDEGRRLSLPPLTPSPVWRYIEESKNPFLAKAPIDYPAWEEISGTTPTKSGMHVPLIAGDRFIGAVNVQSSEENAFDESDLRLLTTLANSMSVALENARLFNEAGIAREEAEASRRVAEDANEAKSAFMSNMSHELRTPLNAILGFTRIVKRKATGVLPDRQVDNLGKVLSSSEHLLGLINTVLDIAKIEAGRMDVISSRFHIGQVIEAVATISQPLVKPGVDLHLMIAPGLPELNSDQDKIKQIMLNLLSNAAKFTHEGSITVAAYENGDTIRIDVTDTGIGMSEDALSRVFEEFQQADAATRKKYGGTGLGMPISKHLAQLLGGDLTVVSNEGEGSMFTLTLPIKGDGS